MLLAVLAMVGLFTLFAFAAGIIRFADRTADNPLIGRIADHAFDGIAVTDPRGHVVYANAAYLTLTGATTPQDVRPVERVFIGNPDVSEAVFRLLKAAREGKRQQEEVRVAGADGDARPLAAHAGAAPRRSASARRNTRCGRSPTSPATASARKTSSRNCSMRSNISIMRRAASSRSMPPATSPMSMPRWRTGSTTISREIGSGGLKLADIVSGDGASLLTSIVAGARARSGPRSSTSTCKMRDGKTMPVRLYHKVAFGADGMPGPSRTLVINRARDEHADPQRAAEVRFMRFFDNTPMAIATVDGPARVVRANARFAQTRAEPRVATARRPSSIFRGVNRARPRPVSAAISQAADGQGDIAPVEVMLDGARERWGQFFVTAVEEDDRETEAAIVYVLETTERRALENQINQSQKMETVGQLAGGIAHDFNNVLSAIMMATDFLLNAHKPTDPSFQDIMQIKQNANRAATLVRQLLAFSRRQTLRPQVLDLGDVLSDLTMLLRRLIGEKVELDVVHGRDLWPVKVDSRQFEQVIVNLAVNARDAMPDGGKLDGPHRAMSRAAEAARSPTRACRRPIMCRIEVADTGTGIPADIIDKIFEPFFSTKEVGKGTGLGLSTVYGIVKQTGGFIYVDPRSGKGTAFRIFLPRHRPEKEAPAGGARRQRRGERTPPPTLAKPRARPHRAGHHPAGGGRGGPALAQCARPALARLQRDEAATASRRWKRSRRRTARSISSSPTW